MNFSLVSRRGVNATKHHLFCNNLNLKNKNYVQTLLSRKSAYIS